MNKISPSNPGILSNNLEKGGMDFLEAVRKGGNDERAEGFPIQNLQPLVKLRLWTASFLHSTCQCSTSTSYTTHCNVCLTCSEFSLPVQLVNCLAGKWSVALEASILEYCWWVFCSIGWKAGKQGGRWINGWKQLCQG